MSTTPDPAGYTPDPPIPSPLLRRYTCPVCGARYETTWAGQHLHACRNTGCPGRPERAQ